MKVGLYPLDSKIPNLALMKLSTFHKKKGDSVELYSSEVLDFLYDKVYVSKVFTWSNFYFKPDHWIIGGSGYDLSIELPIGVEPLKPDYSLYPDMKYSLGFTTRG